MKKVVTFLFIFFSLYTHAQVDSLVKELRIGGNVGITNNGISIIPTFSLHAPALVSTLSFSNGGKFSIDPDVRLALDGRKGSALLWFRYKLVSAPKFRLIVGAHPAYNFALRTITENGQSWNITQARRFWATEIAPTYIVNNHFSLGLYYLNGHGLQDDGPKTTHFVTFNTSFTGIPVARNYTINFSQQAYYLQVDKGDGYYLFGSLGIVNTKSPLSIVATYNKEINSHVTGSRDFDWNVSLMYKFNKKYKLVR